MSFFITCIHRMFFDTNDGCSVGTTFNVLPKRSSSVGEPRTAMTEIVLLKTTLVAKPPTARTLSNSITSFQRRGAQHSIGVGTSGSGGTCWLVRTMFSLTISRLRFRNFSKKRFMSLSGGRHNTTFVQFASRRLRPREPNVDCIMLPFGPTKGRPSRSSFSPG